MKTVTTLLVATLLTNVGAMAMTSKAKSEDKVVYEVLVGDSSEVQGKMGLAVDVNYKSQHVDVGMPSDVNITLSTGLSKGILKVNLRPLKANSIDLEEQDLEFTLTKGINVFPINLQVTSQESGIHYINLTISVEGQSSKVVAIPVNIGSVSNKIEGSSVEKTEQGVAISVSSAEEEIR
jgi:hypothetical protein